MNWVNAVVQGVMVGGLYALFATGLSLTFGVLRFVNLAHGDLAVLSAYLVLSWSEVFGGNYWLTAVLVVAAMAAVGYVLQRGVFNFTVGVDPLPGILVSFGLGIALQSALQEKFTATDKGIKLGDIRTKSITINDRLAIGWFPLLTLITAVVVIGTLHLFITRAPMGRAFRATGDDPATAQLMGINDKHVYGAAMAIAFGAVAIGGFFQGARTTFGPTTGGLLLLFAFEAVVIGGLGSLWGTLVGGIVLGVSQNLGNQWSIGSGILVGHLVFLTVLAVRPRGLLGSGGTNVNRVARGSVSSTVGTTLFVIATIALVFLPSWGSKSTQLALVEILYYLSLAQMWNLLAGYAGLVSVGQQGFVGIAAYTVFILAEKNNVDPWLSVVLAGLVAAVISVPIAQFTFRLTGGYFAIATWVIAEVIRLVILQIDSIGAGTVQSFTVTHTWKHYDLQSRTNLIYWVALALGVGATAIAALVVRSRFGLALQAVRDDSAGARGLGVRIKRTRMIVWVIAALWTGMTGALIHLNSSTVTDKDAFSVSSWTALVIFMAVIGGVGSMTGPIIGVMVYWFITKRFEDSDTWRFIILGLTAAAMAVVSRRGVDGLLQKIHPFEIFPIRRRLRVSAEPTVPLEQETVTRSS